MFMFGFLVGTVCFCLNILTSIFIRFSVTALARDSDKLVFISKTRYWPFVNFTVFGVGTTISLSMCLLSGGLAIADGDHCIAEATGGSLGFLTWFEQWNRNDYPLGTGAVHPKGQRIKNPWAIKADELKLSPLNLQSADEYEHTEEWAMYMEFMHDYFELQGRDCSSRGSPWVAPNMLRLLLLFSVGAPLPFFFFLRNSRSYWLVTAAFRGLVSHLPYKCVPTQISFAILVDLFCHRSSSPLPN